MTSTSVSTKFSAPWISLMEVFLFYGTVHLMMWKGERFRPTILVVALALVALCVLSNRFHGDSRERIGLSWEPAWGALKWLIVPLVLIAAPLYIVGWPKRYEAEWTFLFAVLGYPVWSFAQEYALLGFIANRLEDGLPGRRNLVPWLNGLLFSLVHLPNPILMTATFVAGVVFTAVFFRRRNLFVIAIAHAIIGVGIGLAFANINGVMSVGPGYYRRVGNLPRI